MRNGKQLLALVAVFVVCFTIPTLVQSQEKPVVTPSEVKEMKPTVRRFEGGKPHTPGDTTFSNRPQIEPPSPPPAPATSLLAADLPGDNGTAISLTWVPSQSDNPPASQITEYVLMRSSGDGAQKKVSSLPPGSNRTIDQTVEPDSTYRYQLVAIAGRQAALSATTQAIRPIVNPFRTDRLSLLLVGLIALAALLWFVWRARSGKQLFIRKVAGLEAVDEAIGRATEMGRPVLFIPGTLDLNEVETVAALTILGRVAVKIAECESSLYMPVSRSLVMTAARDVVRGSYAEAGRSDRYSEEAIQYLTDEQFGYVAGIDGYMVRHRPAAIFLLGAFYGEALVLAEMGNSVGAIQIAGTARPLQLPFFIAACDYTLIGEELFAASAYLSQEPKQLASLKAQDLLKVAAILLITTGTIAATLAAFQGPQSLAAQLRDSLLAFLMVS